MKKGLQTSGRWLQAQVAAGLALCALASAFAVEPATARPLGIPGIDFDSRQVYVVFKPGTSDAAIQAFTAAYAAAPLKPAQYFFAPHDIRPAFILTLKSGLNPADIAGAIGMTQQHSPTERASRLAAHRTAVQGRAPSLLGRLTGSPILDLVAPRFYMHYFQTTTTPVTGTGTTFAPGTFGPTATPISSLIPSFTFPAPAATPNDPLFTQQWALDANHLEALTAWAISPAAGAGIPVAVLDSGYDLTHEDLQTNIDIAHSRSWTNPATDPNYFNITPEHFPNVETAKVSLDFDHGTSVSGIISATHNNGLGISGLAYNSTLWFEKVEAAYTAGDTANNIDNNAISLALQYVADQGGRVINMSLGSPEVDAQILTAVRFALSKGVIIVAASGNSGDSTDLSTHEVNYPAAIPGVWAVGASNYFNSATLFSNYNARDFTAFAGQVLLPSAHDVDFLAPGGACPVIPTTTTTGTMTATTGATTATTGATTATTGATTATTGATTATTGATTATTGATTATTGATTATTGATTATTGATTATTGATTATTGATTATTGATTATTGTTTSKPSGSPLVTRPLSRQATTATTGATTATTGATTATTGATTATTGATTATTGATTATTGATTATTGATTATTGATTATTGTVTSGLTTATTGTTAGATTSTPILPICPVCTTQGVLTTTAAFNNGGITYTELQGTSFAAPHVAALAALILGRNPSLTPNQVYTIIAASCRPANTAEAVLQASPTCMAAATTGSTGITTGNTTAATTGATTAATTGATTAATTGATTAATTGATTAATTGATTAATTGATTAATTGATTATTGGNTTGGVTTTTTAGTTGATTAVTSGTGGTTAGLTSAGTTAGTTGTTAGTTGTTAGTTGTTAGTTGATTGGITGATAGTVIPATTGTTAGSTTPVPGIGATGLTTPDTRNGFGVVDAARALALTPPLLVLGVSPANGTVTANSTPTVSFTLDAADMQGFILLFDGRAIFQYIAPTVGTPPATVTGANGITYFPAAGILTFRLPFASQTFPIPQNTPLTFAVQAYGGSISMNTPQTLSTTFTIQPFTLPAGLSFFGIPFGLSGNAAQPQYVFSGAAFDLARWDTTTGMYRLFPSDTFASFLPPDATGANPTVTLPPAGIGYWVEVPQNTQLHIEGVDLPMTQYPIKVHAGWNQVANPFPYTIDWNGTQVLVGGQNETIAAAGTGRVVSSTAFSFTGRAYASLTAPSSNALAITAFQGFWVFAYQDATLLMAPNPIVSASNLL